MLPADGTSTLALTVTAVDGTDAPLSGPAVNVTVTTGMGTIQPSQVTTGTDGTASVTLTAGTTGGNATVTAALASVNYTPETAPNATTTVTIVKAQFGGAWPLPVAVGGTATVAVTVTPTSAASSVAFDTVDTSVATVSGDAAGLTLTGVATGTTTLRATFNGSAIEVGTVKVVQIASLSYQKPDRTWADATAQTVYAVVGSSLTFKATPSPGTAWPQGQPQWSGAATGTSPTATVTFGTQSTSATDCKTVTVGCGTSSLTANVVVYSVTVGVRRQGSGDDFGPSAIVAAGGRDTAEHKADVQVQITPAMPGVSVDLSAPLQSSIGDSGGAQLTPVGGVSDAGGLITSTFKSGDVVGNQNPQTGLSTNRIIITAKAAGWQGTTVVEEQDDHGPGVQIDPVLDVGIPAAVTYSPETADGTPITGHTIDLALAEVSGTLYDAEGNSTPYDYQCLDPTADDYADPDDYATLDEKTVADQGDGTYGTNITGWDDSVDTYTVVATDDDVFVK